MHPRSIPSTNSIEGNNFSDEDVEASDNYPDEEDSDI